MTWFYTNHSKCSSTNQLVYVIYRNTLENCNEIYSFTLHILILLCRIMLILMSSEIFFSGQSLLNSVFFFFVYLLFILQFLKDRTTDLRQQSSKIQYAKKKIQITDKKISIYQLNSFTKVLSNCLIFLFIKRLISYV